MYYLYVVIFMVYLLSFIHGCRNRWGRGMKCGSMERIYFPGLSAGIVWKNFEGWSYKVEGAFGGKKWKYFPVY
jgi:hypothetical protein